MPSRSCSSSTGPCRRSVRLRASKNRSVRHRSVHAEGPFITTRPCCANAGSGATLFGPVDPQPGGLQADEWQLTHGPESAGAPPGPSTPGPSDSRRIRPACKRRPLTHLRSSVHGARRSSQVERCTLYVVCVPCCTQSPYAVFCTVWVPWVSMPGTACGMDGCRTMHGPRRPACCMENAARCALSSAVCRVLRGCTL